ncbi:MAG: acyl carrier protein [Oscillospiraceae bacterium]|nr:acyl carrier protein [Oscillospiraceae bacterium]
MENVKDTLRAYIMEHFEIEADDPDFDDDVHLFDYGFVDSLGATEIVLFLEETFGVEITQKDIILYAMNTVNEIAEVVERKLQEKGD